MPLGDGYVTTLFGSNDTRALVLGSANGTMGVLHHIELDDDERKEHSGPSKHKQGTFMGVYIPIVSSMWGVLIFIRFGIIVGYTGWVMAVGLVFLAAGAQCLTTLSLCTVISNSRNYKGGSFGILKRNLGANMAGVICLLYYLGMTTMASVELLGSVQAIDYVIISRPGVERSLLSSPFLDQVVIGGALLFILAIVRSVQVKAVHVLTVVVLGFVLVSFFFGFLGIFLTLGSWRGSFSDDIVGVTGLNWTTFMDNALPDWNLPEGDYDDVTEELLEENQVHGAASALAIIFPMFLGIFQGANKAADLKTPNQSILKGTLAAIATSVFVYVLFFLVLAGVATREMLKNDALIFDRLTYPTEWISIVATILVGVGACAELLEIGPTILHAVAEDGTFSFLKHARLDRTCNGEPVYCVGLSFIISFFLLFVSSAYFEVMATVVTMFFLQAYGHMHVSLLVNEAYSHASWRPTFRYYHWGTAFLGGLVTLFLMFYVSWLQAVVTIAISVLLLFVIKFIEEPKRLGLGTRGVKLGGIMNFLIEDSQISYNNQLRIARGINSTEEERYWNPEILCLIQDPKDISQRQNHIKLLHLARQICTRNSLLPHLAVVATVARVDRTCIQSSTELQHHAELKLYSLTMLANLKAFCKAVIAPSSCSDSDADLMLMQSIGLGPLQPNTVLLSWEDKSLLEIVKHSTETRKVVAVLKDEFDLEYHVKGARLVRGKSLEMEVLKSDSIDDDSEDDDSEMDEQEDPKEEDPKGIAPTISSTESYFDLPQSKRQRKRHAKLVRKTGTIDVWWLVQNGGLPVLIAKVLHQSRDWKGCKIRVFAAVECEEISNEQTLQFSLRIRTLLKTMRVKVHSVEVLQLSVKSHSLVRDTTLDNTFQIEMDQATDCHEFHHRREYRSVFELFPDIAITESSSGDQLPHAISTFNDLLTKYSGNADLVILNLPFPQCDENITIYQKYLHDLVEFIPRVLFVYSSLDDEEVQTELSW